MRQIVRIVFISIIVLFSLSCSGSGRKEVAPPAPFSQETPKSSQAPAAPKTPVVDGAVKEGEYAPAQDFAPYRLWVSRTKDSVFLALSMKTKGWIALGLGSPVMNGATIFLGNAIDGKAGFIEQTGRGHGHGDAAAKIALKSAVKEEGDTTVMEIELPAAKVAAANVKEIPVILAHGDGDSISVRHAGRKSVKVKLE